MTRNPHEIVTLDDQPEDDEPHIRLHRIRCPACEDAAKRYDDGEGYELGRAYGSPKPLDNQLECGCALDGPEYHCNYCGQRHPNHNPDCYWAKDPFLIVDDDIPAKPMRIRYMELPGEINPNTHELTTPFVIVIDRVTGGDISEMLGNAIALNTGARGVLAFEQEIQIGDD